jgi:exodeoxyribonuclease VII small subunit
MAKQTYKELSDELAKVMEKLEGGDLDIDEAVLYYERGLKVVRELESHLKEAENKVIKLKASLEDDEEEE